jgi:alcohol dehydrogenase YqhD (iron-dependent ADH family)
MTTRKPDVPSLSSSSTPSNTSLSAKHPELAHGRGLATLYPAYFRWLLARGRAQDRLAQLGQRLFQVQTAEQFIERFEAWLTQNQLQQSLADLGFRPEEYPGIADYTVKTYGDGQQINALGALTRVDIVEIFQLTAAQSVITKSDNRHRQEVFHK